MFDQGDHPSNDPPARDGVDQPGDQPIDSAAEALDAMDCAASDADAVRLELETEHAEQVRGLNDEVARLEQALKYEGGALEQLAEHRDHVRSLRDELRELREEGDSAEIAAAAPATAEIEAEMVKLRQDLRVAKEVVEHTVQQAAERIKAERNLSNKLADEFDLRLAALTQEHQQDAARIAATDKQIEGLETQLAEAIERADAAENQPPPPIDETQLDSLRSDLAEAIASAEQLRHERDAHLRVESDQAAATVDSNAAVHAMGEVAATLYETIAEQADEMARARAGFDASTVEAQTKAAADGQTIERLGASIAAAESQAEGAGQRAAEASIRAERAEAQYAQLETQSQQSEQSATDASAQIEDAEQRAAEASMRAELAQQQAEAAQQQLAEAAEHSGELVSQLAEATRRAEAAEAQLLETGERSDATESELDEARRRVEALEIQLAQAGVLSGESEQRLTEAERQAHDTQTQLAEALQRLEEAEARSSEAQQQAESIEARRDELAEQLDQTEQRLAQTAEQCEEADQRTTAVEAQLAEAQAQSLETEQRLADAELRVEMSDTKTAHAVRRAETAEAEAQRLTDEPPVQELPPEWITRRRSRLKFQRTELLGRSIKIGQAKELVQQRYEQAELVLAKRDELDHAYHEFKEQETRAAKVHTRSSSAFVLGCIVLILGALGAGSWFVAGQVDPGQYACTVVVEATTKNGSMTQDQRSAWQAYHRTLLLEPRFIQEAAGRMKRRGIASLDTPGKLTLYLADNLDHQSTADGQLTLELRGEGGPWTQRVLDTYAVALVNTANHARSNRVDGASSVLAAPAEATDRALDLDRVVTAAMMFVGALLFVGLIGKYVWKRMAEVKHRTERNVHVEAALDQTTWGSLNKAA